jgi:hypothetical protein
MVGAPQPITNEDDFVFRLRTRSIREENKPPSQRNDEFAHNHSIWITRSGPGLSERVCPYPSTSLPFLGREMHSKAGKAGDEWQPDSVGGQMRMRLLPLAVPLFIPMRANLGPAGCSAIWVFAPEYFSLLQSSLDNAPYERCFRGASALFLWKLCERFQNRRGLRRANGKCTDAIRRQCQLPNSI